MSTLTLPNAPRTDQQAREILVRNFSTFRSLVDEAKALSHGKDGNSAAALAQIAADFAWGNPIGQLTSLELEQLISALGMRFLPKRSYPDHTRSQGPPRRILHVMTAAYPLGGHTRFVWRWIQNDSEHSHSLAFTGQRGAKVPKQLRKAVKNANGRLYFLDEQRGGLLQRAALLQELAFSSDAVILHTHPYDVLPVLAFSDHSLRPPTVYVNHADHVFSIGLSTCDTVAHIRNSGCLLSRNRRGIPETHSTILPIPLGVTRRTRSRSEAKRYLGIPEHSVVLLSIAHAFKYRPINEFDFSSLVLPLLERFPQAYLLMVGPSDDSQWLPALNRFPSRIKLMGKQEGTSIYYESADIYLDSFPFASLTSLLEAGSYGIPLTTFFPYSQAASVLGADDIALQDCLLRATTLDDYHRSLSELIESPAHRQSLGLLTQQRVSEFHCGTGWIAQLELLYARSLPVKQLRNNLPAAPSEVTDQLDELLTHLQRNMGISRSVDATVRTHLGLLPSHMKFEKWRESKGLGKLSFARALSSGWAFARLRHNLWSLLSE
jgi:hypothetical protein